MNGWSRLTGIALLTLGLQLSASAAPAVDTLFYRTDATVRPALWESYRQHPSTQPNIPNCSYAGYAYGEKPLPEPPVVAKATDFGAVGDGKSDCTRAINDAGVGLADASYRVWDTEKWFVSSEGHRISQHIVECGAAMSATAIGDGETQRRSYPGIRGQYGTSGWELVRRVDLPGNAARIADEALALLQAPPCPSGTSDLILGSEQLALQIHESVGHAVELDRILGWKRPTRAPRGSTSPGSGP
jgi:predicted Zn-dependent protease